MYDWGNSCQCQLLKPDFQITIMNRDTNHSVVFMVVMVNNGWSIVVAQG